jgi:Fic family protein
MWIYQNTEWPNFTWDANKLLNILAEVRAQQGRLLGRMHALGFELQTNANLETLLSDSIKTSEIEGEKLNKEEVRSSLAKRLNINLNNSIQSNRQIEGLAEMMIDASKNYENPLNEERLKSWHAALFPTGRSGIYEIIVGDFRNDSTGPMQVVSGGYGKEKVHFQAPNAKSLRAEIDKFIQWYNKPQKIDPILKAAIAHIWFVTLHPFQDGNGRITRALTDMLLSRADETGQRFYSLSTQIMAQRKDYYRVLEQTQKGALNITTWILWFLKCLSKAISASEKTLNKIIEKHDFWALYGIEIKNDRQKLMLNKLLDGFNGKLNSSKWAKIAKCSTDTALRDIQHLEKKGILEKEPGGGRSTSYRLADFNS